MSTHPLAAAARAGLFGLACLVPALSSADRPGHPKPVAALAAPPVTVKKVTQLAQYGITWTFAKPVDSGQFVNGDYWVVGPVVIHAVTPGWNGTCHGSMVDPKPSSSQGYRKAWGSPSPEYKEALRAIFPLRLEGVHSLVSTIGLEKPASGGASEGLETAAVLTVLERIPPADAFRPPYVAGDKPLRTLSQLHWERLPKLPKPRGVELPNFRTTMKRVWLDHVALKGNANSTLHPRANMKPYYFPRDASDIAVLVLLDLPERQELVVRLVQLGIDLYSVSLGNGAAWRAYGGFGNGRRWPILFAGLMLGDDAMQVPPAMVPSNNTRTGTVDKFGEDGHTWYGKPTPEYPQGKPLWGQDAANQETVFKKLMTQGVHAGGDKDIRDPDGRRDGPEGGYQQICSVAWVGPALAARLMGAQAAWNHPAFFDYVDRWIREESAKKMGPDFIEHCWGNAFLKVMWETYRPKADEFAQERAKQTPVARP